MKKNTIISVTMILVVGMAVIAYAIHEVVKIPPHEAGVGHYEKMPMAYGGDVRHYITGHKPYKKEFSLWPGKGEKFEGAEPHGKLSTIYVNDITLESIKNLKGMANNSLIVKENYAPNNQLVAISVMYKVKGYNPDGGDWFWVQYNAKFKILEEGKVKACMDCHGTARENDYIFTGKVVDE
jgi:hypothetical protein